jgi:hypothetical protein
LPHASHLTSWTHCYTVQYPSRVCWFPGQSNPETWPSSNHPPNRIHDWMHHRSFKVSLRQQQHNDTIN